AATKPAAKARFRFMSPSDRHRGSSRLRADSFRPRVWVRDHRPHGDGPVGADIGSQGHVVYVIELDDAVGERVRADKPSVYVGQSAVAPEERYAQYRRGYRSSRYVRNHDPTDGGSLRFSIRRSLR